MGQTGLTGRNTASFDPASTLVRPAMRLFYGAAGRKRYDGVPLRLDDVLVVPDFACPEGDLTLFGEVLSEVQAAGVGEDGPGLDELPACHRMVRKACRFLGIDADAAAMRLELHLGAAAAAPTVRDFGKVRARPGKGQNCFATLALGSERELAFQRSGGEELVFLPQSNGVLSFVGREVWTRWRIGFNTHRNQERSDRRGHVLITVFGESELAEEERSLGPTPSDAKIGDDALRGRLDVPCADFARPSMRIITVPKMQRYSRPVHHDDVIVVPEFFCAEDDWSTYYQMIKEMRESQARGDRSAEWISWHEGAHLLSKNPTGSKTYQRILDRMCDYFSIAQGNRGTRFNWYRDGSDWKPFHHDSAAFNAQRASNQNCTIGISFGASRDLAFRHAKTGELIYFPQRNGMLFYFGRDANILWQHGINALPTEEQDGKGRISIILWGLCTTTVDEAGSPPMLTDDSRGTGKGKGKGKGDWGYDGRRNQACRDFANGRCSYGERCRFAHES